MPVIRSTEYDEIKVRALSRHISRREVDKADTPAIDTAALSGMELGQLGQLGQVFVAYQRRSASVSSDIWKAAGWQCISFSNPRTSNVWRP